MGTVQLNVCARRGSVATRELGVVGELEVKDFTEVQALGSQAQGKILFYNRPWTGA